VAGGAAGGVHGVDARLVVNVTEVAVTNAGSPIKVGFDAVSFIYTVNPGCPEYSALQIILAARRQGLVVIYVSEHALHQLERKPDAALDLARTVDRLPHHPIGTWDEQVGTWDSDTGTWGDIKMDDALRDELRSAAKASADIRDLGALIDCIRANVRVFVTSDKGLCGAGPAKRIADRFGIRILTPSEFAAELTPDAE
jgi:hypothetical protein